MRDRKHMVRKIALPNDPGGEEINLGLADCDRALIAAPPKLASIDEDLVVVLQGEL
jgi:hypothetical protein